MKVAVIGSRNLTIENLDEYLPDDTTEIVSGGAKGIDQSARAYALARRLTLTEFLPEYEKYGKAAPIRRNVEIAEYADLVLAFWNGTSKGTKWVIDYCRKKDIPLAIYVIKTES